MDRSKDYQALVTDVRVGGRVNGWEVARRIREKEPAFPVIYMTADAENWASQGVPNSITSRCSRRTACTSCDAFLAAVAARALNLLPSPQTGAF